MPWINDLVEYSRVNKETATWIEPFFGTGVVGFNSGFKNIIAGDNGYEYYKEVRDRFNREFSPYDFIFLSRAGFNGMMRFNRKGQWNIPFCKKPDRFQQAYVTKIVNQVKNVQNIITESWNFFNMGFEDTILKAKETDFIYWNPPFVGLILENNAINCDIAH